MIAQTSQNDATRSRINGTHPEPADLTELVDRMESAKAAAKTAFNEADALELQVMSLIRGTRRATLADGRTVTIRDNFRTADGRASNKAFKTTAIKRLELAVTCRRRPARGLADANGAATMPRRLGSN